LVLRPSCISRLLSLISQVLVLQSAIDEASINLNKTRAAFQHVIEKANDPKKDP